MATVLVHSGLERMTFYDGRGTHHMRNLPGLLRAFRTASDKSCGGGLGTRLGSAPASMGGDQASGSSGPLDTDSVSASGRGSVPTESRSAGYKSGNPFISACKKLRFNTREPQCSNMGTRSDGGSGLKLCCRQNAHALALTRAYTVTHTLSHIHCHAYTVTYMYSANPCLVAAVSIRMASD